MVKLQWAVKKQPEFYWFNICQRCKRLKTTIKSLFYNHHLSWNYVCDILLEPILWFVENFAGVLGPIFVIMTIVLTTLVVYIAYYVGFPWWWEKSPAFTIFLVIFGNWILVNVCFHYYMGVQVPAGYPPKGGLIPEAVSICKKCIEPKPPRTHHCSVCNRCILKMDHHCPWLNNCVGHYNHRYFFQYMAFTVAGCIFIMIFGVRLAYEEFFLSPEPEPEGHPVRLQNSQYIAVPEILDDLSPEQRKDIAKKATESAETDYKRKLIILAALLCVGTFLALGGLTWWHANLISRGETSVEGRINSTLKKKLKDQEKIYINPYNFGKKENWILFLGLRGRNWRHILFPSAHKPCGTGLSWQTVTNDKLS